MYSYTTDFIKNRFYLKEFGLEPMRQKILDKITPQIMEEK